MAALHCITLHSQESPAASHSCYRKEHQLTLETNTTRLHWISHATTKSRKSYLPILKVKELSWNQNKTKKDLNTHEFKV